MSRAARLVILGAGGDLTARYLLPALGRLAAGELLPDGFEVWGVAHDERDDDGFRRYADEQLGRHATDLSAEDRRRLCQRLRYRTGDATDVELVRACAEGAPGPVVFYLALPPAVFEPAIRTVVEAAPGSDTRLVVEKPFGEDLEAARSLNRLVGESFDESHVFRIDHFLGMRTVQNLLGIRFANRVFAPLWRAEHIEAVELVWDETVALEDRAGYYDEAGAVKDMVQNHLLQLLALAAMERPATLDEGDLRDAKVEVLRRVRRFTVDEVATHTRRARYGAGRVGDDRELPAYAEEDGVDPERGTETFAAVTLFVDDDRWRGVPFRLRTGKALGRDRHEIRFCFRSVDQELFDWGGSEPLNALTMTIEPDTLVLDIALNGSDDPQVLEPAQLRADCSPELLPTYARLLLDIIDGDPTFSIRGDEAEESWSIVEPILAAWSDGAVPLEEYPAGSAGPT
jgi:glucose-6-phosphate 1-dehydrogenase